MLLSAPPLPANTSWASHVPALLCHFPVNWLMRCGPREHVDPGVGSQSPDKAERGAGGGGGARAAGGAPSSGRNRRPAETAGVQQTHTEGICWDCGVLGLRLVPLDVPVSRKSWGGGGGMRERTPARRPQTPSPEAPQPCLPSPAAGLPPRPCPCHTTFPLALPTLGLLTLWAWLNPSAHVCALWAPYISLLDPCFTQVRKCHQTFRKETEAPRGEGACLNQASAGKQLPCPHHDQGRRGVLGKRQHPCGQVG